jgi:von Willebrand factor type A domain
MKSAMPSARGDRTPATGIESSMLHHAARAAAAFLAGLLVAAYAVLTGCSAIPDVGGQRGFGGANGASAGPGGGRETGLFELQSSAGPGDVEAAPACATARSEAVIKPLTMFIAVDKSTSMLDDNKWASAREAFLQFFEDGAHQSLRVALRFWPDAYAGCTDVGADDCSSAVPFCKTPDVDAGPLADGAQRKKLSASFAAHFPDGDTPTSAALMGATAWCEERVSKTQGAEKAAVVFVTDGDPTSCDTDLEHIAAIADGAYQRSGVRTYAVGLAGSHPSAMNVIAAGGHTGKAFMIGSGETAQALLAALEAIQGSAVACSFPLPPAPSGHALDPTRVNVEIERHSAAEAERVVKVFAVERGEGCDARGGFYYDDPQRPSAILLCPSTCAALQDDPSAKVAVILGCSTIPL